MSDNYFNSRLESTDQPAQWQRSASYESEKLKVKKRKIQMYCDFQPALLFLLTQGTKRKHSSALANYKPKIHSIIIKNRELGM